MLLEMACAYDSLKGEQAKEKGCKYDELHADLANQHAGFSIRIVPIIIGDMGSITGLAKSFKSTSLENPANSTQS